MYKKSPVYQIRILRIWVEGGENGRRAARIRFSLENPELGSRRSGRDFEKLVSYLEGDIRLAFGEEPISGQGWSDNPPE